MLLARPSITIMKPQEAAGCMPMQSSCDLSHAEPRRKHSVRHQRQEWAAWEKHLPTALVGLQDNSCVWRDRVDSDGAYHAVLVGGPAGCAQIPQALISEDGRL